MADLTPPFIIPDDTDPPDTANAALGAEEFRNFKQYVNSFIAIWFDGTTGQFLSSTVIPTTALPALAGDVTSTAASNLLTVLGINGVLFSGLGAGLLWNQANGHPRLAQTGDQFPGNSATATNLAAAAALPNGTSATTQALGDNTTKLATDAFVTRVANQGQFLGTATNDNATAGNIGETLTSFLAAGSAASLTTATPANVLSISLTAGDWDVGGNLNLSLAGATATQFSAGIGTTSATIPSDGSEVYDGHPTTTLTSKTTLTPSSRRISLSATTTVYLVGSATFSAGTVGAFGGVWARRRR